MTILVYLLHKNDPIVHIDEIHNGTSSSPDWRPGFGEKTCWFTTCSRGILFLYGQVNSHPALREAGHTASAYLSRNFSLKAAWTGQWLIGWMKQLGENNWD